jgi:hypothetical protein
MQRSGSQLQKKAYVLIDNAPRQRANAFGRPIPKEVKKGGMVT